MALAITKPVVNGSNGTWGTTLNQALDAIVDAHNTEATAQATLKTQSDTNKSNITDLTTRVGVLEGGSGGVPAGSYVARLRKTVSQNIGNASLNQISFSSADYDRLGAWASGTPTRYTCKLAGDYEFTGLVSFAANATGYRQVGFLYNGAHVPGGQAVAAAGQSVAVSAVSAPPVTVTMGVGDYVELSAYHNAGATLGTDATTQFQPTMQVKFLGPHV